ncbi:MAG: 5-formyltetrahydrofolate cyclo-ligase [Lentisphaerae bacterium]|nr:5-formyltetrahydrofolate cyclo-ligase [Lentisphaerota bacterium]
MSGDKDRWRRDIRAQRKARDPNWVRQTSALIQAAVLSLPEWTRAGVVCGYLALPEEVQTDLLIRAAVEAGKRVCVPVVDPRSGRYRPAWLDPDAPLRYGPMRVPEPAVFDGVGSTRVDVWIVPGVVFDRRGGRLGHGRGHYDRMLGPALGIGVRIGLAFEFQLAPSVPCEEHDVRMELVITERAVYRAGAP